MTLAIVGESVIYRLNRSNGRVLVKSDPLKVMGPPSNGPEIAVGLTIHFGSHIEHQTKGQCNVALDTVWLGPHFRPIRCM